VTAPNKAVSDVTIYVEDYAAYLADPTRKGYRKWDALWPKLTVSQQAKLATMAHKFNADADAGLAS